MASQKTVGGGIRNCCPPYDTFPINASFSYGISIINYLFSIGGVTNGVLGAYYLNNLTFTSAQTFYKPDGSTYIPHCWSFIFDDISVMSPTVDVTDFTIGPASGSWLHPKDDCADIIQWRLNQVTNFPTVYGTQPCCPTGAPPPTPNGVRSCCDPTIQYTTDPTNAILNNVGVGAALVGDFLFPVGSVPPLTAYGCWEVVDDATGPLVGTLGAGAFFVFADCASIDLSSVVLLDECCPSATTECDPQLITPLIKRLETFKEDRDKLLNKQGKYTEKTIKELTDLGYGPRDKSTGGSENPSGGSGKGKGGDSWLCKGGRCSMSPSGYFDSQEACIANCESGGGKAPTI